MCPSDSVDRRRATGQVRLGRAHELAARAPAPRDARRSGRAGRCPPCPPHRFRRAGRARGSGALAGRSAAVRGQDDERERAPRRHQCRHPEKLCHRVWHARSSFQSRIRSRFLAEFPRLAQLIGQSAARATRPRQSAAPASGRRRRCRDECHVVDAQLHGALAARRVDLPLKSDQLRRRRKHPRRRERAEWNHHQRRVRRIRARRRADLFADGKL